MWSEYETRTNVHVHVLQKKFARFIFAPHGLDYRGEIKFQRNLYLTP